MGLTAKSLVNPPVPVPISNTTSFSFRFNAFGFGETLYLTLLIHFLIKLAKTCPHKTRPRKNGEWGKEVFYRQILLDGYAAQ